MHISKIAINKIRCFEDFEVNLERDHERLMWTTIIGDNAVGKSTILKCVAMGLSDVSTAAALMKEISGDLIRRGEKSATIQISLKRKPQDKEISIETKIAKLSKESPEEVLKHINSDNDIPWHEIFVCGYGTQLGAGGGNTFERYKQVEAVYTLFNDTSELPNPETIMLRQQKNVRSWLSKKLQKILLIEEYPEIQYTKKGMYVYGPWGKSRVEDLSDGYKNAIQLVVDFFGWQIVSNKLTDDDDSIRGILLIDELESHLHPRWQRKIVDALRTQLPNVQIITTTHSPLIALGTTDLVDALMIELDLYENKLDYKPIDPTVYKGYTVDQILTSSVFDLHTTKSMITGNKMIKFRKLYLKTQRSEEEEEDLKSLKSELENIPEFGETEEDRKRQIQLMDLLKQLRKDLYSK